MLSHHEYVKKSLNTNLFFLRLLKEHVFFIEASLPNKTNFIKKQAQVLKLNLENLLIQSINLSYGVCDFKDNIVTKYTYEAETKTSNLSGMPINTNITLKELALKNQQVGKDIPPMLVDYVDILNENALIVAYDALKFKIYILNNVLDCSMYSFNYPSLIEHTIEETQYYIDMLEKLKTKEECMIPEVKKEDFWNHIMADHAKFIRGYLDPCEKDLFDKSNEFVNIFENLLKQELEITKKSKKATEEFVDFKEAATEGILNCEIKSVIIPLLADHVLREAYHYSYLLGK